MPSSSRSDSLKNQKLDHDSFVAFDHAAAGHDGVRCTLSGSFIAKPCTSAEVAFYESTALHPAFREFIPIYIGTLTSTDQPQPLALAAAAAAAQPGAIVIPDSGPSSTSGTPTAAATALPNAAAGSVSVTPAAEKAWIPSAGKKLETGISIVLENVASGFKRPNVLDLKLGARLWADDALPAKRAKLDAVSKETTSSTLGFRIAGMKVWTGVNGEADEGSKTNPYITRHEPSGGAKGEVTEIHGYKRYDKWYGRSFNADNVKEGLETYLSGAKLGPIDRSKLVAKRLAGGLKEIQQVLEAEECRMYSSSVLIIYEGDPEAMEHALEEEKKAEEAAQQEPEYEEEEDEEQDEDEKGEGFDGFVLQEGGPFEVSSLPLGPNGVAPQTININIDPETTPLEGLEDDEDEEELPKVHDLRLIDFAHTTWTPGQGPDENVLAGVRNLVRIFDELAV